MYNHPPVKPMKKNDWIFIELPCSEGSTCCPEENMHDESCIRAKKCKTCHANLSVPVFKTINYKTCCRPKMRLF